MPNISAYWLTYDIPETAGIENPSNQLRSIGFRANLSCWVIREEDLPYVLMDDLRRAGADVHCIKFDADETPKLLRMAAKAIERDIKATIASADRSARSAAEKLTHDRDEVEATVEYKKAQTRILKTMGRNLKDLKTLAQRFEVVKEVRSLSDAAIAVEALQGDMMDRARLYAEAVRKLRSTERGSPMQRAAQAGQVPGEILADYIEDKGDSENVELGQKLRNRFSKLWS